ncbi:MAG: hypothetical protein M0Z43_02930 [Acidithiobacillus sp.]|nr:hypothetical protein [Acidithiobacillus sp.]
MPRAKVRKRNDRKTKTEAELDAMRTAASKYISDLRLKDAMAWEKRWLERYERYMKDSLRFRLIPSSAQSAMILAALTTMITTGNFDQPLRTQVQQDLLNQLEADNQTRASLYQDLAPDTKSDYLAAKAALQARIDRLHQLTLRVERETELPPDASPDSPTILRLKGIQRKAAREKADFLRKWGHIIAIDPSPIE